MIPPFFNTKVEGKGGRDRSRGTKGRQCCKSLLKENWIRYNIDIYCLLRVNYI